MTTVILITIILHFIFDWILQPRSIANKKGSSNEGLEAVLTHMLINILPFSVVLGIVLTVFTDMSGDDILGILSINIITHFLIDVLLPKGKNEREMINWTAIDQILHLVILISLIGYGR